jgi:hypothetical protein
MFDGYAFNPAGSGVYRPPHGRARSDARGQLPGYDEQRGSSRTAGIFFLAGGVAAFASLPAAGQDAKGIIVGAVGLLILGICSALGPDPHTTIDSRGIHGSWGLPPRPHSIAWSDIANIDSKVRVSGESWYEYVQIKRHSGRTFRLAVPRNSSSKAVSNPHFDENLATMRSYWNRSRTASG